MEHGLAGEALVIGRCPWAVPKATLYMAVGQLGALFRGMVPRAKPRAKLTMALTNRGTRVGHRPAGRYRSTSGLMTRQQRHPIP